MFSKGQGGARLRQLTCNMIVIKEFRVLSSFNDTD